MFWILNMWVTSNWLETASSESAFHCQGFFFFWAGCGACFLQREEATKGQWVILHWIRNEYNLKMFIMHTDFDFFIFTRILFFGGFNLYIRTIQWWVVNTFIDYKPWKVNQNRQNKDMSLGFLYGKFKYMPFGWAVQH